MTLRVDVRLPRFGTVMEEATIVEWTRLVGDRVAKGDALCQIETEKVEVEFESPVDGTLARILTQAGSVAKVGDVLCQIDSEG